jgi:hypothetical protein
MNRHIPILADFPRCEGCGARVLRLGLCSACGRYTEVGKPVLVRVRIPDRVVIEPGDLMDVHYPQRRD